MNRRKKLRLICFSLISLLTLAYLIYSFHFVHFIFEHHNQNDIKLDPIKLNKHLHSICPCRRERIRVSRIEVGTRLKIDVLGDDTNSNSSLKSYEFDSDRTNLACRAYETLRRGPKQKVISYSVYGNNSLYKRYLKLIAQTAKRLYPDWVVRFYHDGTSLTYRDVCELECLFDETSGKLLDNVDVCHVDELAYRNFDIREIIPTFWRWLPVGDDFVDVFLSRDSDFCVVERDREAVDDWMAAGTLFHLMRGIFQR